jgi:hypothetical protein
MVQLAPVASVDPQLLPWLKSATLVPPKLMPVMLSGPVPVFESRTGWAGLVVAMI